MPILGGNLNSYFLMALGKPALLILDMFNRFDFEHGEALAKRALVVARAIARLRDRFDQAGAPVIYVNDNFAQWQGGFRDLVAECAVIPGAPGRIVQRLAPKPGHYYILKPKHSAFLATPLALLLAKLDARELVLAGIATDSCVLATAQDANMREHRVWCPSDAVGAIDRVRHERALALMKVSMRTHIVSSLTERSLFPRR